MTVAFLGFMVAGHYFWAGSNSDERELYAEQYNCYNDLIPYFQAEEDRKYVPPFAHHSFLPDLQLCYIIAFSC